MHPIHTNTVRMSRVAVPVAFDGSPGAAAVSRRAEYQSIENGPHSHRNADRDDRRTDDR